MKRKRTTPRPIKKASLYQEIGISGLRVSSGYIYDEILPELKGSNGVKIYREMSDNDATIAAMISAIELLMRAAQWNVMGSTREGATNESLVEEMKELVEGMLFHDLDRTWDNLISDILSMLPYGWSYFEVMYKRRLGMNTNGNNRSQYDDGLIAPKDIKIRSQDSLDRWELDKYGNIVGMVQMPLGTDITGDSTTQGQLIPYTKSLLFRPKLFKDSPEGRSILRGCYRSWYNCRHIQDIEAIGIERNLNGLPLIKIPKEILAAANRQPNPDPAAVAVVEAYKRMGRDVKMNEQGCAIIPSDTFVNPDGTYSNVPSVSFELLANNGTRDIDTNKSIVRYQQDMMRTVMADFLMLGIQAGGGSGSFALHEDKSALFMLAMEGWGQTIADVFNRDLLPKIWKINNLDYNYMPFIQIGRIVPIKLDDLGSYIKDISSAGAMLFPDDNLENELRSKADLPERSEEEIMEIDGFDIMEEIDSEGVNRVQPSNRTRRRRTAGRTNNNRITNETNNNVEEVETN